MDVKSNERFNMDYKSIKQFSCGILFNRSFSVLDKWGEIADCILYKNKYFSEKYFDRIGDQRTNGRELYNSEKLHRLQLTSNNLIYTHNVEGDSIEEYRIFQDRIAEFLVPKIIDNNGLITRRIGVVFVCEATPEYLSLFASKYFKDEIKGISDIRFAKKEAALSASFSGKDDFVNKIFSIGLIGDRDFSGFSYDYQIHLVPAREGIDDIIRVVLTSGFKTLESEMFRMDK